MKYFFLSSETILYITLTFIQETAHCAELVTVLETRSLLKSRIIYNDKTESSIRLCFDTSVGH